MENQIKDCQNNSEHNQICMWMLSRQKHTYTLFENAHTKWSSVITIITKTHNSRRFGIKWVIPGEGFCANLNIQAVKLLLNKFKHCLMTWSNFNKNLEKKSVR